MSRIAVIGGGLMGHGIALTFARKGHEVIVSDPVASALAAVPDRIRESLALLGDGTDEIPATGQAMFPVPPGESHKK